MKTRYKYTIEYHDKIAGFPISKSFSTLEKCAQFIEDMELTQFMVWKTTKELVLHK